MDDSSLTTHLIAQIPIPAYSQSGSVDTGSDSGSGDVSTSFLDSFSDAVKQANEQVAQAQKQIQSTPMYQSGSSSSPVMPVPSLKAGLFSGASVQNLSNIHPQTRAGARAKGIGQIAGLAGNFVGNYFKKKEAEKTQALAQDLNRTLELQKGLDEAKQVLQQDPNNAAAKASVQKNTALLGSLLNGKNGKDIAKAYDVTFGPGAAEANDKDKIHKQAMTDAMKQAQQDEKAKQFEAQQPDRMAPNSAYQAAMANLKQVQEAAQKANATFATLTGKLAAAQAANQRAVLQAQVRQQQIDTQRQNVLDNIRSREEEGQKNRATRIQVASITAGEHLQAVREVGDMADKRQAKLLADRNISTYQASIEKNNALITGIDEKLNVPKMRQAPDSLGEKAALKQQKADLQAENQIAEDRIQDFQQTVDSDPYADAVSALLNQ